MIFKRSLTRELLLYEFELSHNTTKVTRNICCAKGWCTVDHTTVNRYFKKFRSDCKDLVHHSRPGRYKILDSKVMLWAIEANMVIISRRVSGECGISQSREVGHFHDHFVKNNCSCLIVARVWLTQIFTIAFNNFPYFIFVLAFKIVIDSWKFSMLLLYHL